MNVKENKEKWEEIGQISVDAGICWLGDPCYILHTDSGKPPTTLGKSWEEFCKLLGSKDIISFDHEKGHEGLGVVVSSGLGDGLYPVYVKRVQDKEFGNRIAEVKIKFM